MPGEWAEWFDGGGIRSTFGHSSPYAIGQAYLDITKSLQPDLTIIDFSVGMEGDGPTIRNGGVTVDMKDRLGSWAVIAGKDIMATEVTAVFLPFPCQRFAACVFTFTRGKTSLLLIINK
jgi:hypothetical protein